MIKIKTHEMEEQINLDHSEGEYSLENTLADCYKSSFKEAEILFNFDKIAVMAFVNFKCDNKKIRERCITLNLNALRKIQTRLGTSFDFILLNEDTLSRMTKQPNFETDEHRANYLAKFIADNHTTLGIDVFSESFLKEFFDNVAKTCSQNKMIIFLKNELNALNSIKLPQKGDKKNELNSWDDLFPKNLDAHQIYETLLRTEIFINSKKKNRFGTLNKVFKLYRIYMQFGGYSASSIAVIFNDKFRGGGVNENNIKKPGNECEEELKRILEKYEQKIVQSKK